MKRSILFVAGAVALMLSSCLKGDYGMDFPYASERDGGGAVLSGDPDNGNGQGGAAGKVTAGEWNDLDNWTFWGNLMLNSTSTEEQEEQTDPDNQQRTNYREFTELWKFNTDKRIAVKVTDGSGKGLPGISVHLLQSGKTLWMARTDVFGRADCWVGMFDGNTNTNGLSIAIDGTEMPGNPEITGWGDEVKLNEYTPANYTQTATQPDADILFIVDATGSMGDEIGYLKADLVDIITKAQASNGGIKFRTGALFYRDEKDDYLTRVSQFTDDLNETKKFINKQSAAGGGDYPEAVHTALEHSIQKLAWNNNARTKLAFMLLDAPAHEDHQGVIESLHKSIEYYAAQGIKLIPVASSGVDKSTEFMLRLFAIGTGGTYVFLTNDSGIGLDHIEATVGDYKVEILGDLLVRLITKYVGAGQNS